MRQRYALATMLLIVLGECSLVAAQTVVVPATDRGWYSEAGFSYNPGNYAAGEYRANDCRLFCFADTRNYFVFNLAGVTQPILSAQLELTMPGPPDEGYLSSDPSENYELHDVVTPLANLVNATGGVAAHADLGSGVVYGSQTLTAADMGTVVVIPLNASAVAALDAATGPIGMGGSVTTLDALANAEMVFGRSGGPGTVSQLRLLVAPEPSTLLLLGMGAISLLGYRNAKSRR